MPILPSGHLADADQIRSYDDIVAAHHAMCVQVAAGKGDHYVVAARHVADLGVLYRRPAAITDAMRDATEKALAAIHHALKTRPRPASQQFDVATTWLDHLSLLVDASNVQRRTRTHRAGRH
jgi:hypothetical protein